MKKIIILSAAVLALFSLTACGAKEDENVVTIPVEVLDSSNNAPNILPTEIENEAEDPLSEDETDESTNVDTEGSVEEVTDGLVLDSKYDGLYLIEGHSLMSWGSSRSFNLSLKGIDVNNSGELNVSDTDIPECVIDLKGYILLHFTFENGQITSWDIIEKATNESLGHLSEDELLSHFFPEDNYKQVLAGEAPGEIYLSKYPAGATYVFDIKSEDGSFAIPKVINDTDTPVFAVSIRCDDMTTHHIFAPQKYYESSFFEAYYSNVSKLYVSVAESTVNALMNSGECLSLSGYQAGDDLDFSFEDYICNDTNSMITLSVDDVGFEEMEIVLNPGEAALIDWMCDVTVISVG